MTAVIDNSRPPLAAGSRTLGPWLEQVHGEWMQEVLGVIDGARSTDAGIWVRWGAVRYLNITFAERLRESRLALERLRPHMADEAAGRLWATGELLEQLRAQLDRTVALHRSVEEFSAIAVKFLRALGCWCREVEQAIGQLEWNALNPTAQGQAARLAGDVERAG
jgi:hypothetical protein